MEDVSGIELQRWELLGDLDELSGFLGLAKSLANDVEVKALLARIQVQIYRFLSEVAGEGGDSLRIDFSDVYFLLRTMELFSKERGEINSFVVSGGTQFSATLHCVRAIARRAERTCVRQKMRENLVMYLDRLACLLFDMATLADKKAGKLTLISDLIKK